MVLKTTSAAGSLSATLRNETPSPRSESPLAVRRHSLHRRRLHGDGRALDGRGRVDLEEVEQMIGGHVGQAAGKQHREDAVFANGFVERGDEVLLGDGALGEVLFHQLVFAFGDQLDQRFVRGLGLRREAGGNFAGDLAAAIAAGRVVEGLHGDQVDDAVKSLASEMGNWTGTQLRPQRSCRSSIRALRPPPPPALGWSIWLMTTMRGTLASSA